MNASDSEAEKATLRGCCNAVALLRRFEHGAGRESENLFSRPSRSRVCLSKHGEQTIPSKCGSETEHKLHESTRISCDKDNRDNTDNFWEALQVPHPVGSFMPAYSCPSCHSCLRKRLLSLWFILKTTGTTRTTFGRRCKCLILSAHLCQHIVVPVVIVVFGKDYYRYGLF